MRKNKSSISKAQSYTEMSEFWDAHDMTDYWDQTREVEFEVDIQSEAIYYPVETALSAKLRNVARQRGVSPETLLNLWLKEKVDDSTSAK